ncbi:hypothetical protein BP5796_12193 [Coleophoma crateriformis]|uniref:Uncharacterized protein n=1 Tax=Coleophoma crateriformis TaxID=565419 RepID=A0A3D8QBX0_9HELO|nr:hypothetical protein BP5796_12193 [Coleophoma crateriformis]
MEHLLLRPTGYLERFNIARYYVKFYNKVQVAVTYIAPTAILPASRSNPEGFKTLVYSALA